MIRVESPAQQSIVARIYESHQEHIFQYWDELSAAERRGLLDQIATWEPADLARLLESAALSDLDGCGEGSGDLQPAEWIPLPRAPVEVAERARAAAAGRQALEAGEVGVFLVAGGQGTRLRFAGPKGMFPIGPVTERTLFQLHAEKIVAWSRRLRLGLPWFIMTSEANHDATREFFEEHAFFGLERSDVYFAVQGMYPVVDPSGQRILMESKHRILQSPDGHGGAFKVLRKLRATLDERGVKFLFYFQVDNPLVRICDPEMIGFHLLRDSQFTSKAVAKTHSDEKVGVFCRRGGRTMIVEYTELTPGARAVCEESGELRFCAGNVAIHVLSVSLLDRTTGGGVLELPIHLARKATSHLLDGVQVEGTTPNSIKFETFLFDALPIAGNPVVLEAERAEEFAPVKNFDGSDSPATARQALSDQYGGWLARAGVAVPRDAAGHVAGRIEISPLFADGYAALADRLGRKRISFLDPLVLQ